MEIWEALKEGTASGTFIIKNMSGGNVTQVTLGDVSMDFVAKGRGQEGTFGATCTLDPGAIGYVLDPHEAAAFSFSCRGFAGESGKLTVLSEAGELTAFVHVDGAMNNLGEFRDRFWSATSPTFKFP